MDPVALALLQRYPLPTGTGTANNYRRVDNETVDQDQFSLRIDHRFPTNKDQVFGRLTRFREAFIPVTPLSEGSGVAAGTLGPQDTTASSFASYYQRTFSNRLMNELRFGDTRRTVGRTAAHLSGAASTSLTLPGIPSNARFPNTLPTFLIAGYQQLGSPPNTASDFSTSVTQVADSLTWLKGRHTFKLGADLRWEPRAARKLHRLNFGPRLGVVGRVTDKTVVRAGYGLVWIEQAGITTPFTTPVFPFLQTVSQRTLDNVVPAFALADGPRVEPIALTSDAGLGQGVFAVDRDLGSGYVQQWNTSLQRELTSDISLEVAYVGSMITHVGIPDTNLNQLTVDQLAQGSALLRRVPNPYFGTIPRSSSLGDPTIPVAQLLKPYPQYTTVSLYRNNVGTTLYHGAYVKLEQRFSRGLSYLVSYTRSKLEDDASSVFDASILTGPIANYPIADSFNRSLERDYSN
jgi:hypothetical protein